MSRLHTLSRRALLTAATALCAPTLVPAQSYKCEGGWALNGLVESSTASHPTLVYWSGSGGPIYRVAWARANQGELESKCVSEHYDSATYQSDAYARSTMEFDEVVFTSPGSNPIQVGLHLTIQGTSTVSNGNAFSIELQQNGNPLGTAKKTPSEEQTTGHLSGWNMDGVLSFTQAMTVPVNTPVKLKLQMTTAATTSSKGQKVVGQYEFRLGGPNPIPLPGERYEVFSLPPGITVDSPAAGIHENVWTQPARLLLHADTTDVPVGENVRLVAWNGTTGQPVGLSIGWGPATPPPAIGPSVWTGFAGTIDVDGWWWADPFPNSPELAGATMRVRAVSTDGLGRRVRSPELEVRFQ